METAVDIKAVRRDLACKASQRNPYRVTCIWNNAFFPGQLVEYRSSPQAQPALHKTRSRATVLNGHTPVVWLEGVSGCVALDACTPVEPPCTCLTGQLGPHYCERHAA